MVHRRSMMAGTVLGGVLSGLTSHAEAEGAESQASSDQMSSRVIEEVARAIAAVREEIERQYTFWEIAPIRDQQKTWRFARELSRGSISCCVMVGEVTATRE